MTASYIEANVVQLSHGSLGEVSQWEWICNFNYLSAMSAALSRWCTLVHYIYCTIEMLHYGALCLLQYWDGALYLLHYCDDALYLLHYWNIKYLDLYFRYRLLCLINAPIHFRCSTPFKFSWPFLSMVQNIPSSAYTCSPTDRSVRIPVVPLPPTHRLLTGPCVYLQSHCCQPIACWQVRAHTCSPTAANPSLVDRSVLTRTKTA